MADTDNHRIQKFDSSGNFLLKWGSMGTGNGQFNGPWEVTVDGSGNVYVSENDNHRVQKFDSSGNFITKWGSLGTGDGQFNTPRGLSVDDPGNVYTSESVYKNSRVQKFTSGE